MRDTSRMALWRVSMAATGLAVIVPPLYAHGFYGDPLPDDAFRLLFAAAGLSFVTRMGTSRTVNGAGSTGWKRLTELLDLSLADGGDPARVLLSR